MAVQLLFSSGSTPSYTIALRIAGDAAVIEVAGEIDLAAAPKLDQALKVDGAQPTRVVVNLTEVTFIDSSGLRTIVLAERELVREGIALSVVAPTESIAYQTIQIAELAEALQIVQTIKEAQHA